MLALIVGAVFTAVPAQSLVISSGTVGGFEIDGNQVSTPEPGSFKNTPCGITRTVGDLLVAFDFPGGNAAPVIQIFRWTGVTWATTVTPVTGSGAVNTAAIAAADDIAGVAVDPARF